MVEGIHKIQSSAETEHPAADAFVAIRNLYKGFNSSLMRIEIFKALDFDIRAGESLGIVGESGIGKSTFLHLLGALDRPDRGRLWFRGQDVFSFDDERLARFRNQSVGFVFQFHHLLPEFSTAENAMMPLLINGTDKKTARETAESVLVRVGLKDRLDHRVAKLSGGEQQRVALARALVSKPAMLLADEPTGNLDKRNSAQIHELLIELNLELNMTLVVVTHNLKLASFLSRRVTISDGQLVEIE